MSPKRQKAKQHNAKKTKGQTTQRQKEIGQKNTTPKRQKDKRTNMICKTLHRRVKIKQHEPGF
jgi:hypothetical protein